MNATASPQDQLRAALKRMKEEPDLVRVFVNRPAPLYSPMRSPVTDIVRKSERLTGWTKWRNHTKRAGYHFSPIS